MALQWTTLVRSISELSITGVIINDASAIPPAGGNLPHILYPEPAGFVSDFTMERNSYGSDDAKMTVTYTLNYTYLHCPIGQGRTGLDIYEDLLTHVGRILDAVLAIDTITGAIDVNPTVTDFGAVVDPSGGTYLGCKLALICQEFVN